MALEAFLERLKREERWSSCVGVGPSDERMPFAKETTAKLLDMLVMRSRLTS